MPLVQGPSAKAENAAPILRFLGSQLFADAGMGPLETSGLTLGRDSAHFWTVSDEDGHAYLLTLGAELRIENRLDLEVDDLEGVAFDPKGDRLLAVSEEAQAIISVAEGGAGAMTLHPLRNMSGYATLAGAFATSDPNDGLEGIAIDPDTDEILVLKERQPRLMLVLDPELTSIRRAFVLTAEAGFVAPDVDDENLDVSGLAVDSRRGGYWILSDTGAAVFFLDRALGAHRIDLIWGEGKRTHRVDNPEGIALGRDGLSLNIVTDDGKHSRLLHYKIE